MLARASKPLLNVKSETSAAEREPPFNVGSFAAQFGSALLGVVAKIIVIHSDLPSVRVV
jgi:hypothetical protein